MRPNKSTFNEEVFKIKKWLRRELDSAETGSGKAQVVFHLFGHYTAKSFSGIISLLKSAEERLANDAWYWNPMDVDRVKKDVSVCREGSQKLEQTTAAFVVAITEICFGENETF